jgi:hypothetical protein
MIIAVNDQRPIATDLRDVKCKVPVSLRTFVVASPPARVGDQVRRLGRSSLVFDTASYGLHLMQQVGLSTPLSEGQEGPSNLDQDINRLFRLCSAIRKMFQRIKRDLTLGQSLEAC